jgi:hypothetical protein
MYVLKRVHMLTLGQTTDGKMGCVSVHIMCRYVVSGDSRTINFAVAEISLFLRFSVMSGELYSS